MIRNIIYAGLLLIWALPVRASLAGELAIFSNEPPVIRALLERAVTFERNPGVADDGQESEWQAANQYCEASRLGSAEAQYRLGMLYAFGKGVPNDRALAASLFAVASAQGHFEAQKMLETIQITTTRLPPCVLEAVAPERGRSPPVIAYDSAASGIDSHIENLPENRRWIVSLVETLADWYSIDPRLILSIIAVESNFKVGAKSHKAAMGLMQLIPATAERFNVRDAFDASQNVKGGIAYMRWLLAYFRGDVPLAVAAYNAGEGAVNRYKGVPPYKETREYVRRVMDFYQKKTHPYDEKVSAASPIIRK